MYDLFIQIESLLFYSKIKFTKNIHIFRWVKTTRESWDKEAQRNQNPEFFNRQISHTYKSIIIKILLIWHCFPVFNFQNI